MYLAVQMSSIYSETVTERLVNCFGVCEPLICCACDSMRVLSISSLQLLTIAPSPHLHFMT